MEVAYTQNAQEDISFWKHTSNKKIMTKISSYVHIKLTEK